MTQRLTVGERVAWYRRRRGMSQEILAGMIHRTVDWLSKVENNRIDLDRLSVIKSLADALDVAVGDLIAEPSLTEWTSDSGTQTVSALRAALMDYRRITPLGQSTNHHDAPSIEYLETDVDRLWIAFQEARFGYVTGRVPGLISRAQAAAEAHDGDARLRARALLGLSYQLAAVQLTKFGEADLAWIAADRGLAVARDTGDPVVIGSLLRSVTHALLSAGRYREAVSLTADAADYLESAVAVAAPPELLSVYGTLFLAGSMAAARADDRASVQTFLAAADEAARRLGCDANHMWTAFGPTNVAIHRVATAAELGDVPVAIDVGTQVDVSGLPKERQVRHALEVARAFSSWNRVDDAMDVLLKAEHLAPEQVRYHQMSRQLVLGWMRQQRVRPSQTLMDLAVRLDALD
jgi:transcriptional regulator with XRE-family HTH domain